MTTQPTDRDEALVAGIVQIVKDDREQRERAMTTQPTDRDDALRALERLIATAHLYRGNSLDTAALYGDVEIIRAALAPREDAGWQPIETAPKDRDVLLYFGPDEITTGRWYSIKSFDRVISYWKPLVMSSHGCGCCGGDDDAPTHWMPLPAAPKEQPK